MDKSHFCRALDKYDRLGAEGVRQLLTVGRKDQSGDFTPGCGLSETQADCVLEFMKSSDGSKSNEETLARMLRWFQIMTMPEEELNAIHATLDACGLIAD